MNSFVHRKKQQLSASVKVLYLMITDIVGNLRSGYYTKQNKLGKLVKEILQRYTILVKITFAFRFSAIPV
jgi:hypothetical protein